MSERYARIVEFYVLYTDKTWDTDRAIVSGVECLVDEVAVQIGRQKLEEVCGHGYEAIGPLYHLGEVEDSETI